MRCGSNSRPPPFREGRYSRALPALGALLVVLLGGQQLLADRRAVGGVDEEARPTSTEGCQVGSRESLRGAGQPGLDDHLVEILEVTWSKRTRIAG